MPKLIFFIFKKIIDKKIILFILNNNFAYLLFYLSRPTPGGIFFHKKSLPEEANIIFSFLFFWLLVYTLPAV